MEVVKINKEWLLRLIKLSEEMEIVARDIRSKRNSDYRIAELFQLFGYIESAKDFLEN